MSFFSVFVLYTEVLHDVKALARTQDCPLYGAASQLQSDVIFALA
jgi:hypothetical protein